MELKAGDQAPDFELPDQNGMMHRLSGYRGKRVLLYFYPQDDTPGCTTEACTIRDAFLQFSTLNAEVLGVSVDSVESHKKFAEKYKLTFMLLSDEDKKVVQLYGVWQGRTLRTSFLVGENGVIEKVYENVQPEKHAIEVLEHLKQ